MEKEIHEQPESVMNTMRGRIDFNTNMVSWYVSMLNVGVVILCFDVHLTVLRLNQHFR